ncbi:MAG: hypothetical protein QY326_03195 [Bdellovibrionota bacterium]|nr:MAG: hypothetical protein QY326_03195 [Bdellovibrionota bacterium]
MGSMRVRAEAVVESSFLLLPEASQILELLRRTVGQEEIRISDPAPGEEVVVERYISSPHRSHRQAQLRAPVGLTAIPRRYRRIHDALAAEQGEMGPAPEVAARRY